MKFRDKVDATNVTRKRIFLLYLATISGYSSFSKIKTDNREVLTHFRPNTELQNGGQTRCLTTSFSVT